jgi:hypothetical protein
MYQGRTDEAARHLDAAEKAILGVDDADYYRSWLQSFRVAIRLFADDENEEIAQARLAVTLAEHIGRPSSLVDASYALGCALSYRHPCEAVAAFDRCVALSKRAASTNALALALSLGARAAASQGETEGAKTRLKEAFEESMRDDDWSFLTLSLDVAVDIFWYLGESRAAAVLAGAIDTTLASLRWPYVASRGSGLAVRTANLAQAREALGDIAYEQARAEGAAMSRQDALAFVLHYL